MKLEATLSECIRIVGEMFSIGALVFAGLSIFYLFYGLFLAFFTFGFPLFILLSLFGYGLWNHKKWARYLLIFIVIAFIFYDLEEAMRVHGDLNYFFRAGREYIIPVAIIILFNLSLVKKIMVN